MTQSTRGAPRRNPAATGRGAGRLPTGASTWALCVGLLLLAAIPRAANLTGVGFHGDEDITAFAVRSALDSGAPAMPSGMPYLRGLLYTWLTALSVAIGGDADEAAYRFPSVVFGALTVPLLYLVGGRLVGQRAAVAAAVLLALSSWHIFYSQHARMYATFVFLFLAATLAIFTWQRTGRRTYLGVALLLSMLTVMVHLLGMLLVVVVLVPYLTSRPRVRWWAAACVAGATVTVALAYNRRIALPYAEWRSTRGTLPPPQPRERTRLVAGFDDYLFDLPMAVAVLLPLAATLLGLWVGWRWVAGVDRGRQPLRAAAIVGGLGAVGLLIGVGQLYGAAAALLLVLIVTPGDRLVMLRSARATLLVLGIGAIAWLAAHVLRYGTYEGMKAAAVWPYVVPIHLARQFVLPMLIFVAVTAWLAWRTPRDEDEGVRRCVLIVWLPLLAFGFVTKTEATRYLLELYPFLLLAIAVGVVAALDAVLGRSGVQRATLAGAAALVLAGSGVLSGHGVPQAAASMRATPASVHPTGEFPWHPDHRSAARWLAATLLSGDIVIAEDPLALRWYGVQADYWFRRVNDARAYLYRDDEGILREFYGDSELLADTAAADEISRSAMGRVWLVTSGETHLLPGWFLSAEQRAWLDNVGSTVQPAYTAADGVTQVYCLNCAGGSPR
jgi:hypothetical protein